MKLFESRLFCAILIGPSFSYALSTAFASNLIKFALVPTSKTTAILYLHDKLSSRLITHRLSLDANKQLSLQPEADSPCLDLAQLLDSFPPSDHLRLDPVRGLVSSYDSLLTKDVGPTPYAGRPSSIMISSTTSDPVLSSTSACSIAVCLPLRPQGLIGKCLDVLCFALPSTILIELQTTLSGSLQGKTDLASWSVFSSELLGALGISSSCPSPTKQSSWDRLRQSTSRHHDQALLALERKAHNDFLPALRLSFSTVDCNRAAGCLLALHLLGEDCKLDLESFCELESLAPLLVVLAASLGRSDWVDYWVRMSPLARREVPPTGESGCSLGMLLLGISRTTI